MTVGSEFVRHSVLLPVDPGDEELARDWTLSPEDLKECQKCRGDSNRRWFAIQLCVLRKRGQFLDSARKVPLKILNHLSAQMDLAPVLFDYQERSPGRQATASEHEQRLRRYCGFETFSAKTSSRLEEEIAQLSVEGMGEAALYERAHEYLFGQGVIPPAETTIKRLIASVCARSQKSVFDQIAAKIPITLRNSIDELLAASPEVGTSGLSRFKNFPSQASADIILEYLDLYRQLRELGIPELNLSEIRTEVVFQFYQLVQAYDAWTLKRFADSKRYALLGCFLSESMKIILDYLVELHDQYITNLCRKSRHAFEKKHQSMRKRSKEGLDTVLSSMDQLFQLAGNAPQTPISEWMANCSESKLKDALENCRAFQRLDERGYWDELKARYAHLRRYLPEFLNLPFQIEPGSGRIMAGVELIRKMDANENLSEIEEEIPNQFFSENLRRILGEEDGSIPRAYWEPAIAIQLRDSLRSGQLHLPESRKNVSFWNMIYAPEQWKKERAESYLELSLATESDVILGRLSQELDQSAKNLAEGLSSNSFVRMRSDGFSLTRPDALEISDRVGEVRQVIETRLPKIRIEEVLAEVNRSCGFLDEFRPLQGYQARPDEDFSRVLPAALIAHGTNLGIAAMGCSAKGISVDQLGHVSKWYIRESTIKAANRVIVDYHHSLPLSQVWGDGGSSSSDGQRFGVQRSSLLSSFYPRYFGYYERAVTVYTHTSDQHSVFGTEVISCGTREAVYVLDGLLENDTILNPKTHHTDTHGYTEHLFGLCYLLGYSFMPRIKDLADQHLYKLDTEKSYGPIEPIFSGRIDTALISEQWDQLVRVAASLKSRTAPAHLVVGRLARAQPQDRLAKALTALGRLVKSIYILRYLHEEKISRSAQLQLNRGESRHQMAKALFFANQGQFRSGDYEEMMSKASCLSLLSNAVLVANTKAMAKILRVLKAQGEVIEDADLAKISPLAFKRVIPNGTYHFK